MSDDWGGNRSGWGDADIVDQVGWQVNCGLAVWQGVKPRWQQVTGEVGEVEGG